MLALPAAIIAVLIGVLLFGSNNDPADPESTPMAFHDDDTVPERGAVYRDGKLYLGGAVPSRKIADALVETAAEVVGAANVVDDYVIDPNAAETTYGRVAVDAPFLFEQNSAAISDEHRPILHIGVTLMTLNPEVAMIVIGHTDSTGTTADNQQLSIDRAKAVAAYMIDQGIDQARFELIGKGDSEPIADNTSLAGRHANNRIEVVLLNLLGG
ncbi:MAG: OmpA family protein [Acidobacteria bacterium]|nr:OmpA family protein [Acidobacteriota bacterium]